MKRFSNYHIFATAALITLSSCNDGFLEKLPETEIGQESFFNNEQDLNLASLKLYDFPTVGGYYIADAVTDNAWTTGSKELKNMLVSRPTAASLTTGWDWEKVRNCNFFLENFRKAAVSEQRLNHYEGLGRFFRARAYTEKVKRYSDVPWVAQTIATDNEGILFAARDPREAVVAKIMEDYEFAISNIDESAATGAVNRWVAKADYARFLLYEGTFRKYHSELDLGSSAETLLRRAVEVSRDIMDNGGFDIHNTGNPRQDYGSLFFESNLFANDEIIFARDYAHELLNGDVWDTSDGVFGNYEVFPVKDIVQAYLMEDGSFYSSQPNYEQYEFVKEFQNRDARLYQTLAYPGWELIRSGTYLQGAGRYVQQLAKNFSGYHQIKGLYNTTDLQERNNIDLPLYRFAETLLIYAEAKAELGQLTLDDLNISVNVLRTRAGMPHMKLNPAVDPIQSAKYPNITSPQRPEILEIRRERRVELAFEGFRHDDLMRWEAGRLLEKEPQGIYFSRLGEHDLNGDEVPDIILLSASESIPAERETNSLGAPFIYYRVGTFANPDVSVFLSSPTSGNVQIVEDAGTFEIPKYYYRPVPQTQMQLNPNLGEQLFGW